MATHLWENPNILWDSRSLGLRALCVRPPAVRVVGSIIQTVEISLKGALSKITASENAKDKCRNRRESTLGGISGTLGWIDAHFARALLSPSTMVAPFQMPGKEPSELATGGYKYGWHSTFGSVDEVRAHSKDGASRLTSFASPSVT